MDPVQSQRVLMLSERFGFLLAENLDEVGSSKLVNSENISMYIRSCHTYVYVEIFLWLL